MRNLSPPHPEARVSPTLGLPRKGPGVSLVRSLSTELHGESSVSFLLWGLAGSETKALGSYPVPCCVPTGRLLRSSWCGYFWRTAEKPHIQTEHVESESPETPVSVRPHSTRPGHRPADRLAEGPPETVSTLGFHLMGWSPHLFSILRSGLGLKPHTSLWGQGLGPCFTGAQVPAWWHFLG